MSGIRGTGSDRRGPARGAVSGSSNEAGSDYRAGVAAWFAVSGLVGRDVEGLSLRTGGAIPSTVTLETDDAVDDIRVRLTGGRSLIQAKRDLTLGSKPFRDTVEQWVEALRDEALDQNRDRLVLATESDSAAIIDLREALDRRRRTDHGAPTVQQQRALTKLIELLRDLGVGNPEDQRRLLDVAVVLRVEITEWNASHRALAEGLLDDRVVIPGEGARAFNDLKAAARSAAMKRHGRVLREWLQALEDAGRTVRSTPDGGPSAQAMDRKARLVAYRRRVADLGSEIDLRPLGIPIRAARVEGLAASWEVLLPTDDRTESKRDLGLAIQRRGRMILLGPPGAGKSSALRQVAGTWAGTDDQIVPVVVPLQRYLSEPLPRSLRELVTGGLEVYGDDDALIDELVDRLKKGEAALFLDGLDEVRERRFDLTVAIDQALRDVDAASDIVLATRDVAYAAAATLKWPAVRLAEVGEMNDVLRAVGTELAISLGVPEEDRDGWMSRRLQTLSHIRRQHPILRETPLLTVLTLVLLAERDATAVPESRARILSELIDDQIERKEVTARKAAERWPHNSREEVIGLLRDSFAFVGHLLFDRGEIPRDEIDRALAQLLETRWGFPPGSASAAADSLLYLWDEAGVFVASRAPRVVSGRLRGLVEVAEARHAAGLAGDDLTEWLEKTTQDTSAEETVILAAGLSPDVGRSLTALACARPLGNAGLTAAEAIERGADVGTSGLACLLDALLRRVREAPSTAAAKALARLPIAAEREGEVLDALEALDDDSDRATAVALAIVRWNLPVSDNAQRLRRVLATRSPGGMFVDEGWGEAVVGAAERLVAAGLPCDAEIVQAYRHASIAIESKLDAVLQRHGRMDLRRRAEEDRYQPLSERSLLATFEVRDRAWRAMLGHLESHEDIDLTPEQARRLSELGDLMQTLIPGEMPMTWVSGGERDIPTLLRALDFTIALGGFDARVIAAEARIAARVDPLEASMFLHDHAESRPLSSWHGVDATAIKDELLGLMRSGPLFAYIAAQALLHAPGSEETVARVVNLVHDLDADSRRLASRLVLALDPSFALRWLTHSDPVLGRTAAEHIGDKWTKGAAEESVLRAALLSPDAGVRADAMEAIVEGDGRVPGSILEALDAEPPTEWQCMWCEKVNPPDVETCAQCGIVGNRDIGPGSSLRAQVS